MRGKYVNRILAAVIGILLIAAGVMSNVAAEQLPRSWKPYLWLSWLLLPGAYAAVYLLRQALRRKTEDTFVAPKERRSAFSRRTLLDDIKKRVTGDLGKWIHGGELIPLVLEEQEKPISAPLADLLWERRGVLITGDAGAGKTTTLTLLLQDLLGQAIAREDELIPVVFSLASWTSASGKLEDWLIHRLRADYGVNPDVARSWVTQEEILPLLDGLDEVTLGHRAACVQAINDFRDRHGQLPLVVTSRAADYASLGVRLTLPLVLRIRPLSHAQVDRYLQHRGVRAPHGDQDLWGLLQTPMLLSLAVRAHQDLPPAIGYGSLSDRERGLIGTFVRLSLPSREDERTLAFMGRALALRPGSTFHVEFISRSWLPWAYRWLAAVCTALPAAVLGMAAGYFAAGLVFEDSGRQLLVALLVGGVAGIATAKADNETHPPSAGRSLAVPFAMTGMWAVSTLAGGLVGGLAGTVLSFLHVTVLGLWENSPARDAAFVYDLGVLAFSGLLLGVVPAGLLIEIDKRRDLADLPPGGGLAAEAKLGLRLLVLPGLVAVAFVCWTAGPAGTIAGVLLALLAAYIGSGRRLVAHRCAVLLLSLPGLVARRPLSFLEAAAAAGVLSKAGGGYRFAHRLLLEYFARTDLPGLSTGYRLGGEPVVELRPDIAMVRARELAASGEGERAVVVLRYAGFIMPAREFAPVALAVAASLEPPAGAADHFIAAHEVVIDAGDPDVSREAAFRLATFLSSAGHDNPHTEQDWRTAAAKHFRLIVASGHPEWAPKAKDRLANTSFTVPQQRFAAWEEKLREQRDAPYAYAGIM